MQNASPITSALWQHDGVSLRVESSDNGASDEPTRSKRVALIALPVAAGAGAFGAFAMTSSDDAATAGSTTLAPTTTERPAATSVFERSTTTTSTTTSTTTTTTTTSTTTTTTSVPESTVPTDTLPETPSEPIAPPLDPRGYEDQIQLGGLSIPKLEVEAPLLEGIRLTTLDNGPGHWPGTAMPGEIGNVVIAAHRTSHGGPFRHIDQLVEGDSVFFNTAEGETEYLVTETMIVNPDALWIVDPTDTATATLFACHPPGSVAQRIVVKLELAV